MKSPVIDMRSGNGHGSGGRSIDMAKKGQEKGWNGHKKEERNGHGRKEYKRNK